MNLLVIIIEFFDYNCGYCKRNFTELMELILKISQGEKISKEEILAATKIQDELETLVNERKTEKFGEHDIDLKYLKKLQKL